MRMAITNQNARRVGGVETYLADVLPALARAGHEVAFWTENDLPQTRELIVSANSDAPIETQTIDVNAAAALQTLRAWRPDVIYQNSILPPALQTRLNDIAPVVFIAHAFVGTCISGAKSFKFPRYAPCDRTFGAGCLAYYLPRRCGGLSPVTMLKEFRTQSANQALLKNVRAILTLSNFMRDEFIKHGFNPEQVKTVPAFVGVQSLAEVQSPKSKVQSLEEVQSSKFKVQSLEETPGSKLQAPSSKLSEIRNPKSEILFVGRMENLKGGQLLLSALPLVQARLELPLHVVFAGDGRARVEWERQAQKITAENPQIEIKFVGWQTAESLSALYTAAKVLAMPSVWHEPFGLAGIEAGLRGLPVVAFAVGGIPEWLHDGVNGYLAKAHPPSAGSLADALAKCLTDKNYSQLRRHAVEYAERYTLAAHVNALNEIFARVSNR